MRIFVLLVLLSLTINISAQGLLARLKSMTKTTVQTSNQKNSATAARGDNLIKWSSIPKYSVVKYIEVDSVTGEALKNEDGTVKYRILLVDQFGNKRSAASVATQQKMVKQAVNMILTKVTTGGVLGATTIAMNGDRKNWLGNALIGSIIGMGTGVVASVDDIKQARTWKKVLKQQEKLLKAYRKNYNEEGVPIDASVDPSKIRNLDFNEENTVSVRTDEIKKEVESSNFSTSDNSVFDF